MDESVSGAVGNSFFVKIKVYRVNNKEKIVPVRIKSECFKEINKRMRDYKKIRKKLGKIEKHRKKREKMKRMVEKRLRSYIG